MRRRPGIADHRDTGDIEADADVVAFIYRESVYIKQSPEFIRGNPEALIAFNNAQFKGELIVAKSRSGPVGTTNIWIDAGSSAFGDVSPGVYRGATICRPLSSSHMSIAPTSTASC